MKEILENLALYYLTMYGLEHGIDISDTHLAKQPHHFYYSLCNNKGRTLISVHYKKNQAPYYFVQPQ